MKKIPFTQNWLIVICTLLGVVTGYFQLQFLMTAAEVISSITIKTLQLVSLPILFISIVATLTGMENFRKVRNIGFKVLKYTVLTTLLASLIALCLYLIVSPVSSKMEGAGSVVEQPDLLSTLLSLYPENIVRVFAESNVIGIVFIAMGLGLAVLALEEKQKEPLYTMFSSLFAALLKIAVFVIQFLPIGVWAFVTLFTQTIVRDGFSPYKSLFLYLIVVVGANLIQGLIVLPLLLKWKRISPIITFKGMAQALSTAFFSKSSNATLPITMSNMEENLKIPRKITSFCLPLCSTINMNACAAFIFTTVVFVSMSAGVTFSPLQLLLWVVIATLAAIGNAGVPMGCFFLSNALLAGFGVPLELLGLILPVYTLLDMLETALNVWSDACVTSVIAKEIAEEERVVVKT